METKSEKLTNNWFDKQAQSFEDNRFGATALMIIVQCCWGSAAAMYSLKSDNIILLGLCIIVSMTSNVAFIAPTTPKWCLTFFYTSIITNLFILLFTIF